MADKVKLTARTAFSAGAGVIAAGEEFEVSESRASELEKRGLVERVTKRAQPSRTQDVQSEEPEAQPKKRGRPPKKRQTKSEDASTEDESEE